MLSEKTKHELNSFLSSRMIQDIFPPTSAILKAFSCHKLWLQYLLKLYREDEKTRQIIEPIRPHPIEAFFKTETQQRQSLQDERSTARILHWTVSDGNEMRMSRNNDYLSRKELL